MREFRFRAWHKGFDRPDVKVPIKPKMLYEDREGDCLMWKHQGQPLVVMQDTGIHDENNVPVYEGDIIEYWLDDYESPCRIVVKWSNNGVCYGIPAEDIKVIGNIYETPEMLS